MLPALSSHSRTAYITLPVYGTVEAPSFRQQGSLGKSRQLCDFVATTLQTRGTGACCGRSRRGLPAHRNVRIP